MVSPADKVIRPSGTAYILFALLISATVIGTCYLNIRREADEKLKRQIGQMMIVGFRGTEAGENSYIAKAIKDLNIGGVVLFDVDGPSKTFPRNIASPGQVKDLVRDLKGYSQEPLIVAVDCEGGRVSRLKGGYGFMEVPSHEELGTSDDLGRTRKVSSELGRELFELGLNVNFAPVVDVKVNPENPVIGKLGRSFSGDANKVYAHAKAFIDGQHDYGIRTAIKHFPGHGSSSVDSHKGLADVSGTYKDEELIPYRKLIKDGIVDMVMTAHIVNNKIDAEYPATLSDRYIKRILRDELKYNGVVVSDDMQMGAIVTRYGFKEAVIRAINAGCDILIFSNNGGNYDEMVPYKARDVIFDAVKDGQIPASRIEESLRRINSLKEKLNN